MTRAKTEVTAAQLLTNLILLTFKANGLLLEAGDNLVQEFGLTSSKWQTLGALYGKSNTVSQISREMGLTRQSVQRTIDNLSKIGLVVSTNNPYHERAPLFRLTVKGKAALKRATQAQIKWSTELTKHQSAEKMGHAISALEDLIRSLERKVL